MNRHHADRYPTDVAVRQQTPMHHSSQVNIRGMIQMKEKELQELNSKRIRNLEDAVKSRDKEVF